MKKYISTLLLLVIALCIFGCKSQPSTEHGVIDISTLEKQETEESGGTQPSKQESEPKPMEYEIEDLLKIPVSNDNTIELREFPKTYEEFSKRLSESNCSIVAGRAFGKRKTNPSVITSFSVEKIYAGSKVPDTINVQENFGVYTDKDNQPYLLSLGYDNFPLMNDQPTLLFIFPHTEEPNLYVTALIPLPLPEDHQKYDETYLTEFLDFFRGDRSAYKYPEKNVTEIDDNGNTVLYETGGVYWPKQELSNEALLEQMNEHILIQLVTDYKIKLWPFEHAQYPEDREFSPYFYKLSYPEN